jgi:deoxyribose-phosphate aldolase
MGYSYREISRMIDHSLLRPTMTTAELEAGCSLAIQYDVASVCILPYYLRQSVSILADSEVKPSTTVGFPHGAQTTSLKLTETEEALENGAQEIDAVINISKALSEDWDYVHEELAKLISLVHQHRQLIKIIFENCYLSDRHKVRLCQICGELEADWVKTSTGYASGGATLEDLALMRRHSPPQVQVKAAGGVRDLDSLLKVRELGITRVGASATKTILDQCRARLEDR